MKVETHNHPTAISPFPGAVDRRRRRDPRRGRDRPRRAAEGRPDRLHGLQPAPAGRHRRRAVGARRRYGKPEHIASALQIMIDGPLGGAAFNNEFGRPNLAGYFRVYEQTVAGVRRGYHKPIMIAGGLGAIAADADAQGRVPGRHAAGPARRPGHAHRHGRRRGEFDGRRRATPPRSTSTRCSAATPRSSAARRRSSTTARRSATANPILAIHDVGAGGISQRVPRARRRRRPRRALRPAPVPLEESGLAPKEIWCNESQERYVMAVAPDALPLFDAMCARERCPFAVVGVATDGDAQLGRCERRCRPARDRVDRHADGRAARQAAEDAPRRAPRAASRRRRSTSTASSSRSVAFDVLRHPTVASKRFLITIGDRTVGGLTQPRPDGRAVAGAGRRLRGHARRLRRLPRRGDGARRAHAARRARRAGVGPDGGRRGDHQPARRADRARRASS